MYHRFGGAYPIGFKMDSDPIVTQNAFACSVAALIQAHHLVFGLTTTEALTHVAKHFWPVLSCDVLLGLYHCAL